MKCDLGHLTFMDIVTGQHINYFEEEIIPFPETFI